MALMASGVHRLPLMEDKAPLFPSRLALRGALDRDAQQPFCYASKHRQLHDVNEPLFSTTPFASPQLELIELDEEQWCKYQRRPARNYAKRIAMFGHQLSLLDLGISALILWALKAV